MTKFIDFFTVNFYYFHAYSPTPSMISLIMLSSSSNSTIVPLFEKMLSASDAGRIGRLVLPKACAEVSFSFVLYLPFIGQNNIYWLSLSFFHSSKFNC